MRKILALLGIVFLVGCLFVPLVSAAYVCPAASLVHSANTLYLHNEYPSATTAEGAAAMLFTANATCYLYNVTFYIHRVGSPSGFLTASLRSVGGGTVGSNAYPSGTVLEQSLTYLNSSTLGLTESLQTFQFLGTTALDNASTYAITLECFNATFTDANGVQIRGSASSTDGTMNEAVQYSSGWAGSTNDFYFVINGDSVENPDPTPTPTPTPTSGSSGSGDATLEYWSGVLMPWLAYAVILLIPAFLGLKFLGQMGFIVGLNIGAFLLYLAFPDMIRIIQRRTKRTNNFRSQTALR